MSAPEAWHVTRTLRAMELLAVAPRSAPELADALGVHVRTARRVLKRLESEGYVALTADRRRRYRPTMRIVALAGQVVLRAS
jgi:DNA-binding IclR family transcriptional regulator